MLLRSLVVLFCLSANCVWAADTATPAPAPAAGSKAEEFAKNNTEFTDLVANLGALKKKYADATSDARKAEIRKLYNEGVAKAKAMQGKLVASAQAAYLEKPNADAKVTDFLVEVLAESVQDDDYELAFEIGKKLMDNKCKAKHVSALAGVAAFCVNEYDLAEPWLKEAQAAGTLEEICREFQRADHSQQPRYYVGFLDMIDQAKERWAKEKKIRDAEAKANDLPRVLMKTSQGDIEIELFENEAPNTVLNFITLVDKGFYNGLKFHRVLPAFMAQGGDPKGDGSGGPDYTIPCECYRPDFRQHFRGTLSMAHAGRDTGGSQFFLTFLPTTHLDGKHTAFGRVISGFDVLAKIRRRDPSGDTVGPADSIIEAKVIRKRNHPYDVKDLKKSSK